MQTSILELENNQETALEITDLEITSIFETTTRTAEYLRARLMSFDAIRSRTYFTFAARQPEPSLIMADVREFAPRVEILPAPPWSEPVERFLMRPELARRLNHAARSLPTGFRLGFWEGFRPLEVQRALWESGMNLLRDEHSFLDEQQLEFILETYIARPNSEAPHTLGRAVDVALLDSTGHVFDAGSRMGRAALEMFAHALTTAGLSNYEPEWWHWSLDDEAEYSH